jgi:hypothetical protein
MTDYVARGYLADLLPVVNYLSSVVASLAGSSGTFLVDATALRAKDVSFSPVAVMILSDINGNVGIFAIDAGELGADDGYQIIVDSSSRRWVRQQAPI